MRLNNCKTSLSLFQDGNPELLMYPTNSTGQICGQGENAERPLLFFQNLLVCASMSSLVNGCPTPQVLDTFFNVFHEQDIDNDKSLNHSLPSVSARSAWTNARNRRHPCMLMPPPKIRVCQLAKSLDFQTLT